MLLRKTGAAEISWYSETAYWPLIIIIAQLWKNLGYATVMYLSSLVNIPQELYEAALVDGTTPAQIFRQIVLPLMRPVLVIVLMIRFIDAFKVFDTVYVMTNGGPGSATEMLPNYIYKQGLKFFDAGYSASLAIIFVLVMSVCTSLFLKWRKKEEENLW